MAMNARIIKMMNISVVCTAILLCCLSISQANDCKVKPTRCPFEHVRCYCFGIGRPAEIICENGVWTTKPCDTTNIPTTIITTPTPTQEITCGRLKNIPFATIRYSKLNKTTGYPLNTQALYTCQGEPDWHIIGRSPSVCKEDGWDPKNIPTCSCPSYLVKGPNEYIKFNQPADHISGRYPFDTTATYYCKNTNSKKGIVTCGYDGKWNIGLGGRGSCSIIIPTRGNTKKSQVHKKTTTTESPPIHHNEERTVVIVSGTTGAILGALIILVVIVSCQRRLHYHRMRRARLRHRQDQEAFTAFITYHRDVRLMLPSYDEAMNQQENGQPPTFEEALGHYEEPTLPPGHTPAEENPPSISTDSPTSSDSLGNETHNSPENRSLTENDSDIARLIDGQSSVSPASESSRFFRSLRTLFGGRAFRPDAIYCRFVPEEDGSESPARREERQERESRNNSTGDDDLTDVLVQAGFC